MQPDDRGRGRGHPPRCDGRHAENVQRWHVTGACEYVSEESGNRAVASAAEGAAAKTQFDGYAAAGQLGTKVDGIGDAAYYTDGEISIWKGDHGVGISIDQSDATDDASLKALAVALAKVAAGRL